MTNPIYKHVLSKMRLEWKANDTKRDEGDIIPESLDVFDNISYGEYKKDNLLCIYRPKTFNEEGKVYPCIVIIHGGGFFYGDKEIYKYYAADMAQRGFITVVFNYRLCPEHKFPSPLIDINNLMNFIIINAESFKIDVNKIAFAGDSAGGNLALTYAAILTNPKYAALYKMNVPEGFAPKAVCLNSSLNNTVELSDKQNLALMCAYNGCKLRYKLNKEKLNVQKYLTSDFPRVYMISAPNDFLLYQQEPQYQQFLKLNIDAAYKVYGDKEDPAASHVFHLNQKLAIAKQANDDEAEFIRHCFSN